MDTTPQTLKTFDLFAEMSPALFGEIMDYFYEHEKDAIKMAVQTMAINRKLRPVFIQRKPPKERYLWMKKELGKKYNATIAENLLQTWFMQSQQGMLTTFLDTLEIEHEDGQVEDLPESIDKAALKKGVEATLADHAPEKVTLYLKTILAMDMAKWPEINELIADDERLYLGENPPVSKPIEKSATDVKSGEGMKKQDTKPTQSTPDNGEDKKKTREEHAEPKEPHKGVEPPKPDEPAKEAEPKK